MGSVMEEGASVKDSVMRRVLEGEEGREFTEEKSQESAPSSQCRSFSLPPSSGSLPKTVT